VALYLAIFIGLALATLLDLVKDDDPYLNKRFVYFSFVTLLIFISSIRWETGPDWDSYHNFYVEIEEFVKDSAVNFFEPGFTWINYAFSTAGLPYTALLTFFAVVTIGLKAIVFARHTRVLFLLLFLYYCYYLGDILFVRQFTAVSMCLYGLRFVEKRQFWPFVAIVLLATSIHVTALFFVVAYWLYWARISDRKLYLCLLLALIIGLIDITNWLVTLVVRLVGVDAVLADKILKYGDEGLDTGSGNPYLAYALGVLKRSFILPILIIGKKWVAEPYRAQYRSQLNLLVFGNVIYFVFILSVPVITRLALPFLYMEIFMLAILISSLNDMGLRLVSIGVVIAFGLLRLYLFMQPYWDLYVPFQTIWDQHYELNRY